MKLILISVFYTSTVLIAFSQIEITSIDVVHESCFEASDGQITVFTQNEVGNVFYDIGFGQQSSNTFTNVPCGTFTVSVYDMTTSATSSATVDCATQVNAWVDVFPATEGNCDAMAYTNASGGTPPYTYTYSESPDMSFPIQSGPMPDIYGLCGWFTYYVTVTDANGCGAPGNGTGPGPDDGVISFEVMELTPLFAYENVINNSCEGSCTGSASISITGGMAPYQISDPNGGNDIQIFGSEVTFSDLCTDSYTLTVTDFNFQQTTVSFNISDVIIVPNPTATNETSSGACDGTVTANASGGAAPYNYVWNECSLINPVWTGPNVLELCAADYQVTVTDVNGCSTSSECVTIGSDACNFSATTTTLEETCSGMCLGVVDITAVGGTAPYTLTYDNNDYPFTINYILLNLCQGVHQYSIVDANGCSTSGSFEIFDFPLYVNPNATNESAPGACDGTLSIDSQSIGGSDPYTYIWLECGTNNSAGSTETVDNVCAGDYELTVMDDRGCIASSSNCITVGSAPCNLTASENIYHYSCTGNPCAGEVEIIPSGGTGPYVLTYENNDYPFTINYILANICEGQQPYTIEDANACIYNGVIDMQSIDMMFLNPTATDETIVGECDGTLSIDPLTIGGIDPYSYYWEDCNTSTNVGSDLAALQDICPGSYAVTVMDVYGCIATSNCITVNGGTAGLNDLTTSNNLVISPNPVTSKIHITSELEMNQIMIVNTSGRILSNRTLVNGEQTTMDVSNLASGVYFIEILSSEGVLSKQKFIKL